MIIGINGRYLEYQQTGIGLYIFNLINRLKHDFKFVIYCVHNPKFVIRGKNVEYKIIRANRFIAEQFIIPFYIVRGRINLYICPSNVGLPLFRTCPHLLIIHDLIPLVMPDFFKNTLGGVTRRGFYWLKQLLCLISADKIICLSISTRNQVIKRFGFKRKILVIGNGISKFNIKNIHRNKGLVISNIGGIEKRKNIPQFIDLIRLLIINGYSPKAYITGNFDNYPQIIAYTRAVGLTSVVNFTGYINRRKLGLIIQNSRIICSTSKYEGFGLPIIEALSLGKSVIASSIPPHIELSDLQLTYYDPTSLSDLYNKVLVVYREKENIRRMNMVSRKTLAKFDWANISDQVKSVIQSMI